MIKDQIVEELKNEDTLICCPEKTGSNCVKLEAIADLPTIWGNFTIIAFSEIQNKKEHIALVKGNPIGKSDVLVRLHSECLTGDSLGSLRCDCRAQLHKSLEMIQQEGEGILLYLRQEGRGIGLINKIRAYSLQDTGVDTIEANIQLGFAPDLREYGIAAHMLRLMKIQSIRLLTNNPDKIRQLESHKVVVTDRIPLITPPTEYNKYYLETKAKKAHHLINFEQLERIQSA